MNGDMKIRAEACRLAAEAFKSPAVGGTNVASDLWCLSVFFEEYIRKGAKGTAKKFGPKGPAKLRLAIAKKTIGQRAALSETVEA